MLTANSKEAQVNFTITAPSRTPEDEGGLQGFKT